MPPREAEFVPCQPDVHIYMYVCWPQDRWYQEKLNVADDQRRSVVVHYIEGLHWVLEYYYRGVASWNWFYPHHHAPMASDMTNLNDIQGMCLCGGKILLRVCVCLCVC